ncbi:hypothetical protein GCWU000282_03267 [Catonella morbi ATCC 51271]|uniref:Uncharacterized protein n=1 Tax=Catonella morbi ATCC 51271 TaxID=592026 RepID=V2Y1Y6_9FIRM|nr:hypothetical protein GCWU000282_03267 [Catonella morbi ATCC 51271]
MKNNKRLKERNIYFNKLIAFKDTDSKNIKHRLKENTLRVD